MADIPREAAACKAGTQSELTTLFKNPELNLVPITHYVNDLHKYMMESIIFSDHKAGFLFAAVATVLAYMHSHGATQRWMTAPASWGVPEFLAFLGIICLIVSGIATILVVAPRFKGSVRGLVYFKAIACYSNPREYLEDFTSKSIIEMLEAKIEGCYDLACICDKKYRMLAFAIWCGSAGLVISAVYLSVFK